MLKSVSNYDAPCICFMHIVSTGQGQAEVTKGNGVQSAHEYCVTHVSGVYLGRKTKHNVYFGI